MPYRKETCRSYGRGLLQSYFRLKGYIAREDDERDAIAYWDVQSTRARRRGSDKHRKDWEFITSGPDFLWCCDGHDKFRNYGIENLRRRGRLFKTNPMGLCWQ